MVNVPTNAEGKNRKFEEHNLLNVCEPLSNISVFTVFEGYTVQYALNMSGICQERYVQTSRGVCSILNPSDIYYLVESSHTLG